MLPTKILRKEIGIRLKQARENAGYGSVEEFCQKNNVPLGRYLAYERGGVTTKILQLVEYSDKLQVSVAWVMLGDLAEKFPSDRQKSEKTKETQEKKRNKRK